MKMKPILMVAMAACAFGHHSLYATYFLDQEETIQGKVVQFLLRNPHSFLQVDAPDANGVMQRWVVEWLGGGQLGSRGIGRNTLMAGDEVTITMSPSHLAADHRGLLRLLHRPADGFEWGTKPGEEPVEWGTARK